MDWVLLFTQLETVIRYVSDLNALVQIEAELEKMLAWVKAKIAEKRGA